MRLAVLAILLAGAVNTPVSGHHGTAASYDESKQVTVRGKVTEFWWRNPHSALFIDAVNDNGERVNWSIEMGSPGVLTRAGWNRRMLGAGDMVSIVVHPSRAGTPVGVCANPCNVTANGKTLSVREP
jgi:uncharacterized protein DUF6152